MSTRKRTSTAPKAGKTAAVTTTTPPDDKAKKRAKLVAQFAVVGSVMNAATMADYARSTFGDLDSLACNDAIEEQAKKVINGDLSRLERTLTAQALALDAMFNNFARRAALNIGEYIQAADTYARLAMKAQAQCRATIETIAEIKQPRAVAFVKQANIAHGHQQVNNGVPPARTENESTPTNELLEADHGQRLDTTTASTSKGIDTAMATVGALDGTAHG